MRQSHVCEDPDIMSATQNNPFCLVDMNERACCDGPYNLAIKRFEFQCYALFHLINRDLNSKDVPKMLCEHFIR